MKIQFSEAKAERIRNGHAHVTLFSFPIESHGRRRTLHSSHRHDQEAPLGAQLPRALPGRALMRKSTLSKLNDTKVCQSMWSHAILWCCFDVLAHSKSSNAANPRRVGQLFALRIASGPTAGAQLESSLDVRLELMQEKRMLVLLHVLELMLSADGLDDLPNKTSP